MFNIFLPIGLLILSTAPINSMQKLARTTSIPRVKCMQPDLSYAEKQINTITSHPTWDNPIKKHLIELLAINAIMQQRPGLASPELSKYEQALKPNVIPGKIRARGEKEVWRLTNPSLRLPVDIDNGLKEKLEPLLKSIDATRVANFNYRIQRDDAAIHSLTQLITAKPYTQTHNQPLRDNLIKQQLETIIKKRDIITHIPECEKDAELLEKYIPLTQNKELSDQLNEFLELLIEDIADAEIAAEFAQQAELKKTTPPSTISIETNRYITEEPMDDIIVATEIPTKSNILIKAHNISTEPTQITDQKNQILPPVIEKKDEPEILVQLELSDESFEVHSLTPDSHSTGENSPLQASEDSSQEESEQLLESVQKDIDHSNDTNPIETLQKEEKSGSAEIVEASQQIDNTLENNQITSTEPEQPSSEQILTAVQPENHQEQTQITNTSWLLWLLSKSSNFFWWFVSIFISL